MSKKDYFTGKKAMSGNKRSHALNHSRRSWGVNLQTVKITLPNGEVRRVKVSTKTLKTLNKKNIAGCKKAVKAVKAPKTEIVVEAKEVKVEAPAKKAAAK